jgi:hypothetical protein
MTYSAEISRNNPTALLFLIDRSGSMADSIGDGGTHRKADVVADAINRLLQELSIRCAKEEGVRDYFHVGVIGYGAQVGPAFGGALSGRPLVPISDIASTPARIEDRAKKVNDGAGGLVDQTVKFPIWLDPAASGGTPMCEALNQAQGILSNFLNQHPGSFPPIAIHFTDGESTDGDPSLAAESVKSLGSADGNVLLFNCHISSGAAAAVRYPDSDVGLPDQYAKLLFSMSSTLPPPMLSAVKQLGQSVSDGTRGFVLNADFADVVQFLDIGTRVGDLR